METLPLCTTYSPYVPSLLPTTHAPPSLNHGVRTAPARPETLHSPFNGETVNSSWVLLFCTAAATKSTNTSCEFLVSCVPGSPHTTDNGSESEDHPLWP